MKINYPGKIGITLTLISRTRRAAIANAMASYGFASPMYEIAIYVWRHPGESQDAITEATLFDKATVARGAQKLEALGYIRRESSERDRRQYELYLTEKGAQVARGISDRINSVVAQASAGLGDEDRRIMYRALSSVCGNLARLAAKDEIDRGVCAAAAAAAPRNGASI